MENRTHLENNRILQLVSFCIGTEEFGVDILKVQEIIKLVQITRLPDTPDSVEGVINLRGRIIPVIDLRARLGLEKKEYSRDNRIIVVELSGRTIGFIVDSVSEVLRIPADITEPPPTLTAGIHPEFITAIGKLDDRLLILLNLEKVLLNEEKEAIGAFEENNQL